MALFVCAAPAFGQCCPGSGFEILCLRLRGRRRYPDELYPFSRESNMPTDDSGNPITYGMVMMLTDLSLKYRLSLQSRWDSEPEWQMWPGAKILVRLLAVLHVWATLVNAMVILVMDEPLLIFEALAENTENDLDGVAHRGRSSNREGKVYKGRSYLDHMPEVPQHSSVNVTWKLIKDLLGVSWVPLYFGTEMIISILGLISSPFFFVFLMLDYFRRPDGRLVLQAIIVGGPNLLRSFVIGIIVVIIFGFYSYTYFSPSVIASSDLCHSPFQCVAKHILDSMTGDLTTVLGDPGGSLWSFPALAPWADMWQAWRSFFVFVSIIFWVFLLQGIIQGQIIDAFAEMRARDDAAHQDLEQRCFISSIERFVFNNYPGEWEKRRGGQYAWNYLFYFLYLINRNKETYNGIENRVAKCLASNKTDFLPVGMFTAQYR